MTCLHPDLHLHSTASDGSDTPLTLLEKVREAGVDMFSLTDHDTYGGCREIQKELRRGDPLFIAGIELSCQDELGKYHILGYCYNASKDSIREATEVTHRARLEKAQNRLRFLEEVHHFTFTEAEKKTLLQNENPGKPHFVSLLQKKGYVSNKEAGFTLMGEYRGEERRLRPEEAIDAILSSDGIPVLAHGLFEDGEGLLSPSEMAERAGRLKDFGLMGMECYYSTYTAAQSALMLDVAESYNLMVTAGSDYHGKNKPVTIGQTGPVDPKRMDRFFRAVERLL